MSFSIMHNSKCNKTYQSNEVGLGLGKNTENLPNLAYLAKVYWSTYYIEKTDIPFHQRHTVLLHIYSSRVVVNVD